MTFVINPKFVQGTHASPAVHLPEESYYCKQKSLASQVPTVKYEGRPDLILTRT